MKLHDIEGSDPSMDTAVFFMNIKTNAFNLKTTNAKKEMAGKSMT